MKRIVEHHLRKLRRARERPEELERLRSALVDHIYPPGDTSPKPVHQKRIPRTAPDWYFESELRRSGLWEMMERCYPSPLAQAQ